MVAQSMAPAPRPFIMFGGSRLAYGGGRHGFEVVVGRVRGRVGEFHALGEKLRKLW